VISKLAWLCFLSPLIGGLLSPVFSMIHPKLRDYGALFFSLVAALIAMTFIPYLFHPSSLPIESGFVWLTHPIELSAGVLIDPLSIVLTNVVAVISFIIMVYSLGYMKGDPSITRFWMWMNLFIGSMLFLVLSNNLLFIFIGWKMVGLCSYGLIGFYYKDEKKYWIGGPPPGSYCTPSHAGLKALVVTSVGDLFMLGGILMIYAYSRTLNLLELYETASTWIPEMGKSPGILILTTFLLLAGPMGKSAQFAFHEWLPEAMAGPGPVSALIHAATMVKSGVYLVARFIPIFFYGYWVSGCGEAASFFTITAWVGAVTAFLAATQGMVALEMKKVLAYSTISQIGYMMLGLGIAGFQQSVLMQGFTSGIFHLVSHALFKAALFLCAGSVIHTVHTIYMHEMGSLKKVMPYTWLFMSIAALSLMGIPPLPGFWSKDAILASILEANSYPLFLLGLITVVVTSFYTTRFIGMVFYGKESDHIQHLRQKGTHLGEVHPWMWVPCGVLTIMILLVGLAGPSFEHFLEGIFGYSLREGLPLITMSPEKRSIPALIVPFLSVLLAAIGAVMAYFFYISRRWNPASLLQRHFSLRVIHQFFLKRWYIHDFYYGVVIQGVAKLYSFVPNGIEDPLDRFFHRFIPSIPERIHSQAILLLADREKRKELKMAPPGNPSVGIGLGFALLLALLFFALYLIVLLIRGQV
jgi:NADH-quinone oxidoreductase subunit L